MKTIIQLTLFIFAAGRAMLPLEAALKNWEGGTLVVGDPEAAIRWSEPGNWDPPGVPQNGDELRFFATAAPGQGAGAIAFNDVPNLTVASLSFGANADLQTATFWIPGSQTLGVSEYIELAASTDANVDIAFGLRLDGNVKFRVDFFAQDSKLHLGGPVNLNGHNLALEGETDDSIEISGVISGSGNVRVTAGSSSGTVKLSGDEGNTFFGDVHVLGAELILDKQSGLAVPGPLIIGTNKTVKLDRPDQIVDTATVVISPGGQLKLQGNRETISGLFLNAEPRAPFFREALVDTGGATLSVNDNITATNWGTNPAPVIKGQLGLPPGSHIIHTLGSNIFALKIEASIIGEGGFTKTGDAGLILAGNNSFNGDAVLQEGSVHVSHANALGSPSGATILYGGELYLNGVAIGLETLFVDRSTARVPELGAILNVVGISSWAGLIELNTNLTVSGGTATLSGQITGPGGLRLIFNDRVQLTGSAPNTYTGDTLCDAGLLELNKPFGVAAFGGRLIVDSGSGGPDEVRWLQDYQCIGADVTLFPGALINLNNHREDFGPVTFHGGSISTGTGALGVYGLVTVNPSSDSAFISGRLGFPPGPHEFRVSDGAAFPDLRIDATILGAGSLRKTGAGQMWLAASNSYEGLTTVAEGTLSALDPHALGAPANGTTVDDGATLDLNFANISMPEPLAIGGTGVSGGGALEVFGNVTLRNPFPSIYSAIDLTRATTIGVGTGSRLTVDGIISGTGPLTKAGPGLLILANVNPNTYSGDTFVANGVLTLSKPNSAISVPGNLIVGPAPLNSSAIARWSTEGGMNPGAIATINASSLLDLNGNGQSLSRLNLNDGGDAQTGAGTLSFAVGGIVNVGSLSLLGSHASSSFSGNIGLPPNATVTFAVNPYASHPPFDFNPELVVSAAIPAPIENVTFERAGLTKTGVGTMRSSGNNSYGGWTDVAEGTLIAGNSLALGAAFFRSGTYVFNDARLALEGSLTIESERLFLNSTATPAVENLSAENYWSGPVILQRHSSVGARASSLLQLAGVISGAANFTKLGAGTVRFGGGDHNTYSGETFVNEGVLLMSKPTAVTSIPGSLSIGTPAGAPAMAANLTSYQVVGNIFVNRGGLLNLNGEIENVDHLWLSEGGDVQTTIGILFLKSGGSIQVVPGAVGDPSTIAGNLDMDAGAHVINVGSGTSAAAGPDLEITALVTSSLGPVTPRKYGPGTLRLAANNTYSGTTVADEGVLRVDGVQLQSRVQVNAAGTLQGIGVVDSIGFGGNGVVAPGASPGVLSCNSLLNTSGSGILEIELNGPAPGANGYDQLNVYGIVTLSGITLRVRANFIANTNQQFVLIDNQGANAVGGTFTGLAENADIVAGDQIFRISYFGRDGNDVVLTKIADVFRPALTIERVSPASVRLLWPTNDPAFTLQFTTNLSSTSPIANWFSVSETPVVIGSNRAVTNNTSRAQKFYRLAKP